MAEASVSPGSPTFQSHVQDYLANSTSSLPPPTTTATETASVITTKVLADQDLEDALWRLWGAIFSAVSVSTSNHGAVVSLLKAICGQCAAKPVRAASDILNSNGELDWALLPQFFDQWRDTNDILLAWRSGSLNGEKERLAADPNEVPTGEQYLHFNIFSATLVGQGFDGPGEVWGFFACRRALEWTGPETWIKQQAPSGPGPAPLLSAEQVWSLDVRVAAVWIHTIGKEIVEYDTPEDWSRGVKAPTDKWKQEDSEPLSGHRWNLWIERFEALSEEPLLEKVAREDSKSAGETLKALLAKR